MRGMYICFVLSLCLGIVKTASPKTCKKVIVQQEQLYYLVDARADLLMAEDSEDEGIILKTIRDPFVMKPDELFYSNEKYREKKTEAIDSLRKLLRFIVECKLVEKMRKVSLADDERLERARHFANKVPCMFLFRCNKRVCIETCVLICVSIDCRKELPDSYPRELYYQWYLCSHEICKEILLHVRSLGNTKPPEFLGGCMSMS